MTDEPEDEDVRIRPEDLGEPGATTGVKRSSDEQADD